MVCTSRIVRGGRPAGLRGIAIDITDLKRAQSAFTESKARFIRLTQSSDDIIYRYELAPEPRCSFLNTAVTRVTGYTPEEFYADPNLATRVMHPEDREVARGFLAGSRTSKALTIRVIHKDGHIVFIEQRNVPVLDSSGKLVALEGIARDITERVKDGMQLLQRELTLAILEEHERLERDIAELLHGTIQTRLLVAWHKLGQCELQVRSDPESCISSLIEARSLIDEIREKDIRAASHRLHPSIISIGLAPAVRSLVDGFESHTAVCLEIQPELAELDSPSNNMIPEATRLAVYRVLEESLNNIYRHAGADKAVIRLGLNNSGLLSFSVSDNGRGFTMGSAKLGLGLRTITGRVEQAGGVCEITTGLGHGTTIRGTLPLNLPDP